MTTLPASMMAAYVDATGAADTIRFGRLPVPAFGPTDVLVDVICCAVNPIDTFVRSGRYKTPMPLPFVIGRDMVGVVAALGPGAVGFAVGQKVWCNSLGHAGRQGAAAQCAVVAGDRLYPLPDGVDPFDAVALLHPAASAFLALFEHGALHAGETVFIAGAAGHVGSAATRLAVEAGATVIASASEADAEYCRGLGASAVLDYRADDLASRVKAIAPRGVDLHLDTSAKHDLDVAVDLLASRGRIVLMAGLAARPFLPVGPLYVKDGRIAGFTISTAYTSELQRAAKRVNGLLADGVLSSRRTERLSLSEAAEAHRRLESGQARGVRLVLAV
jgi:NADPH:quinone reductase-like Zn-dependent oxidoreductase